MEPQPENLLTCYICETWHMPRTMKKTTNLPVEYRELGMQHRADAKRAPMNLTATSRFCTNCHLRIKNSLKAKAKHAGAYRVVVQAQNACFICHDEEELRDMSRDARINVFIDTGLYVPARTKCCKTHFKNKHYVYPALLKGVIGYTCHIELNATESSFWLQVLQQTITSERANRLNNIEMYTDEEMKVLTGITRAQFDEMYDDLSQDDTNHNLNHQRNLFAFLCKLRTGLSDDTLRVMFGFHSRECVSHAISVVRINLKQTFAPKHLGINAISREEYINKHVTDFAQKVFNPDQEKVAIVIIDGTYLYMPKSSNYRVLRQSFCVHKGRHLVKPILLVSPSGRILDVHGPYFSDSKNNDAACLIDELNNDRRNLKGWLQEKDIIVVDKGYRDSVEHLVGMGVVPKMPAYLRQGSRQLSELDANLTRLVTKVRWVVEARNGHIKSIFRFFRDTMQMTHVKNIGDFFRIACAIINAFMCEIESQDATPELATWMLEHLNDVNIVKAKVDGEGLNRRRTDWIDLTQQHLPGFPRLTLDEIKDVTKGPYQIRLARSYTHDKIQRDSDYKFQIIIEEPGLVRVRMYSRHKNRTQYNAWISYNDPGFPTQSDTEPDLDGVEGKIFGYYCDCPNGARTVTSCGHITSILWYLGYARYEDVRYPKNDLLEVILDAGNRDLPEIIDANNLPLPALQQPQPNPIDEEEDLQWD